MVIADLIDHHGSVAAVARALRTTEVRLRRALAGDVASRTVNALARIHATLPRCVGCGDVLHARWADATCAACQQAARDDADAAANDTEATWQQWAARKRAAS